MLKTWFEWSKTEQGGRVLKWLDRVITVGLIGLLIIQIYDQPFDKLLGGLPTSAFFYLLYGFLFMMVPVSEYYFYQVKWTYKNRHILKGFVLKKIYNNELYNYTGEAYFVNWISERLGIRAKEALLFVKDHNIVSSLASTFWAFFVLFVLSFMGYFDLLELISGFDRSSTIFGAIALIIALIFAYRFRKNIIHLPKKMFYQLFALYSLRFIIRHFLLVLMWMSAAPEVSILVWINFLMVKILLDRLPLGNRTLILLSMAPWLSGSFDLSIEVFTGIQLMVAVLDKIGATIGLIWAKRQPLEVQTEKP